MTKPPRKHDPRYPDRTVTARSQKRTKWDDELAARISNGKYPTLRRLMTAARNNKIELVMKEVQDE